MPPPTAKYYALTLQQGQRETVAGLPGQSIFEVADKHEVSCLPLVRPSVLFLSICCSVAFTASAAALEAGTRELQRISRSRQ